MDATRTSELAPMKTNITKVERKSDREVVVTRSFDAPARLVFEAWSKPELFKRWWVPKSMGMTLRSCEMDVRTGGRYRLGFGDGMDFFGRYLEVTPPSRIVWTNEEGGERLRHHGHLDGDRWQDAARRERALSLEGSARRRRWRRGGCDARDIRAIGRAARQPGRERGPVMTSWIAESVRTNAVASRAIQGHVTICPPQSYRSNRPSDVRAIGIQRRLHERDAWPFGTPVTHPAPADQARTSLRPRNGDA